MTFLVRNLFRRLDLHQVPAGPVPVLAIHGISSQRRLWNWLRAAAPDLSLVAPDLRGRGDSTGVTLSSSIGRHAADMVLVLNNRDLPQRLSPGRIRLELRWAWLIEGAARWFAGQTEHARAAIARRSLSVTRITS